LLQQPSAIFTETWRRAAVEHLPMRMADMMAAASNPDLLRRVVWRHLRSNGRIEFCEVSRASSRITLFGKLIGDAGSAPAYVAYELLCSSDLARCTTLRLQCTANGERRTLTLEYETRGRWFQDGAHRPELDGCTDPDLEWSPSTNTFPIRRLAALPQDTLQVRAAWVRFPTLEVLPIPQSYTRLSATRYRYRNEHTGYTGGIDVDELDLPITYEGVWTRTADWSAP
jgi:hypothetical protein